MEPESGAETQKWRLRSQMAHARFREICERFVPFDMVNESHPCHSRKRLGVVVRRRGRRGRGGRRHCWSGRLGAATAQH